MKQILITGFNDKNKITYIDKMTYLYSKYEYKKIWENTFSPTIYKTWDCKLSENLGLDMIPKKVNMVD